MDDLIDQYERVNSLLDHQIKINELLYGDQAYKYLNKFYEKQRQNNQQELSNLREQQQYWQERLDSYQKDGQIINPKAWL
jgi:FtsZ-binding cell division protein ZapB